MSENIFSALALSAVAGLSTTIGALIGISLKEISPRFMSANLGFAAGVMIFISFVELFERSINIVGLFYASIAFFSGMLFMFVLDFLIPHEYIGESMKSKSELIDIKRTSLFIALGVAIHNFPEGMATFAGAMDNLKIGFAIAFAIAAHNIPEGLAVSIPIFVATKSHKKAFFYSFLSGLSEPIGASLAAVVLYSFLTPSILAYMLAFVAGLMVFISLDELVPASRVYGFDHTAILAVILGMTIMWASLLVIS